MTRDDLIARFEYEPATGMLRQRWGKPYPWRPVGYKRRYLGWTAPSRELVYLHRAVWLYHHGWAPKKLDHKDNDPRNCKLDNLRPATNSQNAFNARRRVDNASGFKGVIFRRMYRHPWQARIVKGGKQVLIGRFDTPEEAHAAYVAEATRYAGEFARTQ